MRTINDLRTQQGADIAVSLPRDLTEGWLTVPANRTQALVGGVPAALNGFEYEIVRLLAARDGEAMTLPQMLRATGGSIEDAPVLRVQVRRLRDRLAELGVHLQIEVVAQPREPQRMAA